MISGVQRSTEALAAVVLALMMALTVTDVVGRYFFNAPLASAFELTRLLMALLVFSALPMVSARENHIVVELFVPSLTRTALGRTVQRSVVQAVSAVVMAFIGWQVWQQAANFQRNGDTTPSLSLPLFPFVFYMALLAFVTALVLALVWYAYLARGRNFLAEPTSTDDAGP